MRRCCTESRGTPQPTHFAAGLLRACAAAIVLVGSAPVIALDYDAALAQSQAAVGRSVADYAPKEGFDLVLCHDVLQYLDDRTAVRALANLARLCRGALYFSVLTAGDWRRNADRARTDRDGARLRPAAWYKSRLARHFRPLGGGLLVRRGHDPLLWELERPWLPGAREGAAPRRPA